MLDNGLEELLIIGLNDSQGVDTTFRINKKSCMRYLRKELDEKKIKYEMFDCFSLLFNKTYHIDAFLKHNIDKKTIRELQIKGNIMALKKFMIDYSLPKFLSKIRNIYRLTYKKPKNNKRLTTELINNSHPFVIYSSGANDLMQLIGTDPYSVIVHYKKRNEKPNYNYALNNVKDNKILKQVIDRINNNFAMIKKFNINSTLIVLGAYIPLSLREHRMADFKALIDNYNIELRKLCSDNNAIFIDTNEIGYKYNTSKNNFHISTKGHKHLAHLIMNSIAESIQEKTAETNTTAECDNLGLKGIIQDIDKMYEDFKNRKELPEFRYNEINNEFINELEVLTNIKR